MKKWSNPQLKQISVSKTNEKPQCPLTNPISTFHYTEEGICYWYCEKENKCKWEGDYSLCGYNQYEPIPPCTCS